MPSSLSLLPFLTVSFLSEINNKMLYYGEEQELSPEEISEKLMLAQKMLEEIRHRRPFLTQRELVDEEADEAYECRCIQFLESHTSASLVGPGEDLEPQGNIWPKQPIRNIQSYLELICSLRESLRTI